MLNIKKKAKKSKLFKFLEIAINEEEPILKLFEYLLILFLMDIK